MVVQTPRSLENHRFQAVMGHILRSCLKRNTGGWRDSSVSLAALAEDQCLIEDQGSDVHFWSQRAPTLCAQIHTSIYLVGNLKKKTKDI